MFETVWLVWWGKTTKRKEILTSHFPDAQHEKQTVTPLSRWACGNVWAAQLIWKNKQRNWWLSSQLHWQRSNPSIWPSIRSCNCARIFFRQAPVLKSRCEWNQWICLDALADLFTAQHQTGPGDLHENGDEKPLSTYSFAFFFFFLASLMCSLSSVLSYWME